MNVANLELCKELYELSGWDDTTFSWAQHGNDSFTMLKKPDGDGYIAAYGLGYLLRKLPHFEPLHTYRAIYLEAVTRGLETAWRIGYGHSRKLITFAPTPEDAACALAIELFKQGILSKEDK